MIQESIQKLFDASRKDFYQRVFSGEKDRKDGALSPSEVMCAEVIYYMGRPTLTQFSSFLNISPPNATYKIKQLVLKGYVEKESSNDDRRQSFISVSKKFMDEFRSDLIADKVAKVVSEVADGNEAETVERVLDGVVDALDA